MADSVAIYGAAIGSAAAIGTLWNIYNTGIRDRARLYLRLGREFFAPDDKAYALVSFEPSDWAKLKGEYPQSERKAHIQIANIGRRPISILEAGLEFSDKSRAAFKPGTTDNLGEGEFMSFRVSEGALAEILRASGMPKKVYARDSSGKTHRRAVQKRLRPWLEELRQVEVNVT